MRLDRYAGKNTSECKVTMMLLMMMRERARVVVKGS
jgi:hypothetical protein